MRKAEANLGSTDAKAQRAALEEFTKLKTDQVPTIKAYATSLIVNPKLRKELRDICKRIEEVLGSTLGAGASAAATSGAAAGASAAASGAAEGSPVSPQESHMAGEFLTEIESLKDGYTSDEIRANITVWAGENRGLEGPALTAFMNAVYAAFYDQVLSSKEIPPEIHALLGHPDFGSEYIGHMDLKHLIPGAVALAVARTDPYYKSGLSFVVAGDQHSYRDLSHMFLASKLNVHPDIIKDDDIRNNPGEFLMGVSMAQAHLETGVIRSPSDGKTGGAAAGAAASATAGSASASAGMHGIARAGSNCWANAALQFFAHSLGIEYLRTLPESPLRDTIIELVRQYQANTGEKTLPTSFGQEVRRAFARAGMRDISLNDSRQQVAAEAILYLLQHGRTGADDSGWVRERNFRHPTEGRMIHSETHGSSEVFEILVPSGAGEGDLLSMAALPDEEATTSFRFTRVPKNFTIQLMYTNSGQGKRCPLHPEINGTSFTLDGFILHQGAATREGGISGGHYTTVIRKGTEWFHCDDGRVTKLSPNEVRRLLTPGQYSRPTMLNYQKA
ncbi:MAG: hypothetical protein Q8Q03_00840 [bacterium]|nr:hypothetical protein [bacterium]